MQAARDGEEDSLDYFLQHLTKQDINALGKEGFAALHYAVMYHRLNAIRKLLEANCRKLYNKMYYTYAFNALALWKQVGVVVQEKCSQ